MLHAHLSALQKSGTAEGGKYARELTKFYHRLKVIIIVIIIVNNVIVVINVVVYYSCHKVEPLKTYTQTYKYTVRKAFDTFIKSLGMSVKAIFLVNLVHS